MALLTLQSYSLTTVLAGLFATLTLTAFLINKVTIYLARRRFKLENGCQPIGSYYPLWDKIFGIDNMLGTLKASREGRLLERAVGNFRRLGNTFGVHLFGQNVVATIEPENVKAILSLKFKDFSLGNRNDTLGPFLGTGIFNSDGEAWAHSRAMIRPNFTRDQVADLDAFERHIQDLFKIIPRDGSTVDLQELFFRFTIDSATEFLFGKSVNSLRMSKTGGPDESTFATAFNNAQHAVALRARTGFLRNFIRDPKGMEAIRIVHEYVDQFVDEAVRYREQHDDLEKKGSSVPQEKYVFLYELAKATKDKRRLRDELLNVLLAGRDTTASLLSNMWFMLAQRPEIYEKLQREVREALPEGQTPTYAQLRNMKYLKYCMNESLRIHPVVPANSRLCIRDTFLPLGGGRSQTKPLFIPKGTIVVYNPYGMHRRSDFYGPDANEYRPERWETLRPGWEYLPFNGGPRICLGQQYALTEAGYVTVRLLQEFSRVESRDENGGVWMENLSLTVCSRFGTKVALTPA